MKILCKFLAVPALLAAMSVQAHASPLSGNLTIDGGYNALSPAVLNDTTTSIVPGGIIIALGGTGSFASVPYFEQIVFASNFTIPPGTASLAGEQLFSFNYGGTTEAFEVNKVVVGPNGSLIFYGILSDGVSADDAVASFTLTPNISGDGSFSSTLSLAHAPEPNSVYLLGSGLFVIAAVTSLRRRPFQLP